MKRAVLFPGALALVFSLACGSAGCDVFLEDWGETGQPCTKRSHCKYEQYCVGQRCTPYSAHCESDSDCRHDDVVGFGSDSWCTDDNVCDHPPIAWDSIECPGEEGQTLCTGSNMTCTAFPAESEESGQQWFCSLHCFYDGECPVSVICMLSEDGPSCGDPSWTADYGVVCGSDDDCNYDLQCVEFESLPGSGEYLMFCVDDCAAGCQNGMECCRPDGAGFDICVPSLVCP